MQRAALRCVAQVGLADLDANCILLPPGGFEHARKGGRVPVIDADRHVSAATINASTQV